MLLVDVAIMQELRRLAGRPILLLVRIHQRMEKLHRNILLYLQDSCPAASPCNVSHDNSCNLGLRHFPC
jgi:hypothetical protein